MDERELHLDQVHRDDIVMRFACPQLPHESMDVSPIASLTVFRKQQTDFTPIIFSKLNSIENW
jgi:hypothetical protein